jgi:hypothetical protein
MNFPMLLLIFIKEEMDVLYHPTKTVHKTQSNIVWENSHLANAAYIKTHV